MRQTVFFAIAAFILLALSGCGTLEVVFGSSQGGGPSSGSSKAMMISGLSNNTEKVLEAGEYRGLTVTHNSVTLTGKGTGNTFISGNVTISGNNCTIRNLTIQGDVVIEGNNADLTNARITGTVSSSGNNNSW